MKCPYCKVITEKAGREGNGLRYVECWKCYKVYCWVCLRKRKKGEDPLHSECTKIMTRDKDYRRAKTLLLVWPLVYFLFAPWALSLIAIHP